MGAPRPQSISELYAENLMVNLLPSFTLDSTSMEPPWAAIIMVQWEPKMWSVRSTTRMSPSILSISDQPLSEAGHEDTDLPSKAWGWS